MNEQEFVYSMGFNLCRAVQVLTCSFKGHFINIYAGTKFYAFVVLLQTLRAYPGQKFCNSDISRNRNHVTEMIVIGNTQIVYSRAYQRSIVIAYVKIGIHYWQIRKFLFNFQVSFSSLWR